MQCLNSRAGSCWVSDHGTIIQEVALIPVVGSRETAGYFLPLAARKSWCHHITSHPPPAGNPWSSSHVYLPVKPFGRKWINSLQRCQRQLRVPRNPTRIPLNKRIPLPSFLYIQNHPVRDQTLGKVGITEMQGMAFCQWCWEEMRCLLSSSY